AGKLEDIKDVAFRVIADHLRMLTFAITDGGLPSNKGRGAVIRSVLRRAFRFGWQCFDQREPFIYKLVPALVAHMGSAYPELRANPHRVQDVLRSEEADFLRTIERGMILFNEAARQAERLSEASKSEKYKVIKGVDVFNLHATYGFPPDLTRQMAQERGLDTNMGEYEELMEKHRKDSGGKSMAAQVALNVSGGLPTTGDRPKWVGPTRQG